MSTRTDVERELAPRLLDLVHDAFWAADPSGRIIYLNELTRGGFSRALGIDLAPGVNFLEELRRANPPLYEYWRNCYRRVLTGDEIKDELVRFEVAGGLHDYLVSLFVMRDLISYEGTAMCSVVKEVTDVRELEREAEVSLEKFETVFDISPAPTILTAAGIGRILNANEAFAEMVGYRLDELVGKTTRELRLWVDPGDRTGLIDALGRKGRKTVQAVRFRKKSGEVRFGSGSFVRMKGGGAETTVGIVEDITDRKRAEERQVELTRMEAVGQLAGGIAHDFNNLLTVILTATELLQAGKLTPSLEQRMQQKIHTAATRAAELTWKLLAFGRRQPLQPRPSDPREIVKGLVHTLDGILGENIELRCELEDESAAVKLDVERFHQVLINLALNARDAMPEGGVLTFRVRSLGPDAQELPESARGQSWVLIEVGDTGRGIRQDVLTHIFEPFYTTKPLGEGSGLGLSQVYGFVRQSGGHIEVDSTPGEGARFRILLPTIKSTTDQRTAPPPN